MYHEVLCRMMDLSRRFLSTFPRKLQTSLTGMCKTDREDYEKYWDDISPFIKFGCLKDEKFCDKMKDAVLFKDLDGQISDTERLRRSKWWRAERTR